MFGWSAWMWFTDSKPSSQVQSQSRSTPTEQSSTITSPSPSNPTQIKQAESDPPSLGQQGGRRSPPPTPKSNGFYAAQVKCEASEGANLVDDSGNKIEWLPCGSQIRISSEGGSNGDWIRAEHDSNIGWLKTANTIPVFNQPEQLQPALPSSDKDPWI